MKATELLLKQHREIEQLLERLRTAGPENEGAIRRELADLLVAHTVMEEEHFYPTLREMAPERVLEAIEQHGLADYELARDLSTRPGDENARARAAVLAEVVLAHVRMEENDLIRRAESALTNQELAEIGEVMMATFEQAIRTGHQKILARKLAANIPKLALRGAEAGKSAQRGRAKKKATVRRGAAAKRGTARKIEGGRAPAKRGTAKRGTAKRGTAKRGTAKRGTAKRGATTKRTGAKGGRTGTRGAKSRASSH
jgi:hypothetical protein